MKQNNDQSHSQPFVKNKEPTLRFGNRLKYFLLPENVTWIKVRKNMAKFEKGKVTLCVVFNLILLITLNKNDKLYKKKSNCSCNLM